MFSSLAENATLKVDLLAALTENESLTATVLAQNNFIALLFLIVSVFGPGLYYGVWVMYYDRITKLEQRFKNTYSKDSSSNG